MLGARVLKLYNAFVLPVAGRRFSPYALLRHTGRRSGRAYQTPLGAYRFDDGFVLGLTYGPDSDWCRNVVASGHAVLSWHRQDYAVERPEILPMNPPVLRAFPLPFRRLLARELRHCLWLQQSRQTSGYRPLDAGTGVLPRTPEH
jgi:deazaflavin-dependent oxidoreductase (nitroreductase family)